MNVYLLEQNTNIGYDTYDSCVVIAKDEESARLLEPDPLSRKTWADTPEQVKVTLIGVANKSLKEGSVICSSFNAG